MVISQHLVMAASVYTVGLCVAKLDPSAGFSKKFGLLNHIFGGSYGIRLKIRPNTTNSANKTDKLRQSN